jgi:signal peptidase I
LTPGVAERDTVPNASTIDARSELKFHLAVEVLRSYGEAKLPVTGDSMLPSIWPGDTLEVRRESAAEILPGEVVLFARQGFLVVHRVVRLIREPDRTLLVTRGDRIPQTDAPVSPEELLGRVTAVLRGNYRRVPLLTFWGRMVSSILARSEFCTRVALRLGALRRSLPPAEALWAS